MKVIFDFDYSIDVVDKKLYDKLEAKHEADCRLISEYDLEIKKLKKQNEEQNETVNYVYSNLCTEQKEHLRCEAVIKDLKFDVEKAKAWEKRYNELEYMYEKKDAENNRLEDKYERQGAVLKKKYDEIDALNKQIDSFGLTCRIYEKETKDLKADVERWVERHNRLRDMDKKRLFDFKNTEKERDHYKGLYSSKCDDYDTLLEKQLKTEKEVAFYRNSYYECCSEKNEHIEKEHDLKEEVIKLTELKDNYKNLFHSLNHKHQKVVGEMKRWKERAIEAEKNEDYLKKRLERPDKLRTVLERENDGLRATLEATKEEYESLNIDYNRIEKEYNTVLSTKNSLEFKNTDLEQKLKATEEKLNDARIFNKMREDVFEANLKLKKTIEAKDREIDLLRAELDKYKTDDECDDRWID